MGTAGAGDAPVDGAREGERSFGVDNFDLRVGRGEPFGGCVGAAVIDNDDLSGRLREDAGELGLEQFLAGTGWDDNGDARLGPSWNVGVDLDRPGGLSYRPPHVSRERSGSVPGDPGPIRLPGGPQTPAQSVGGAPRHVPRNRWNGPRPEHEVVEVFVESEEAPGRENQRQQAHAAERHVGDKHHTGEADLITAQLFPAAAQVLGEGTVDAITNPSECGILRWKIGHHPQRQLGIEVAQVLDEAPVEVLGAGSKGDLDLRIQRQISRCRCTWAPPVRLVSHNCRAWQAKAAETGLMNGKGSPFLRPNQYPPFIRGLCGTESSAWKAASRRSLEFSGGAVERLHSEPVGVQPDAQQLGVDVGALEFRRDVPQVRLRNVRCRRAGRRRSANQRRAGSRPSRK